MPHAKHNTISKEMTRSSLFFFLLFFIFLLLLLIPILLILLLCGFLFWLNYLLIKFLLYFGCIGVLVHQAFLRVEDFALKVDVAAN